MQDILTDFFMNNPLMDRYIVEILNASPAYRQEVQRSRELDKALTERLDKQGMALFLEYEATVSAIQNMYCMGYYLFGLKLRRELREALWRDSL